MASHQFAIAKASFSAGLLRPDPTSLSREAIAHFHSLLNTAVQQCSPRNVQKCKQWIVQNVVQSTARFAALGKYLTALASSFTEAAKSQDTSPTNREPSIKRRRIHILYILNDILYHAKYHIHDASISSKVQPILVDLITTTASFKDCPKHQRKVLDLLDLWEDKGYYSAEYIDKLRETARNASEFGGLFSAETALSEAGTRDTTVKVTKAAPYVMPAFHGDSSTPWFDLPAGNLMPHIVPNSTRPINPELIKPLQLVAGPADESLAFAVKALLDDVDKIFGLEEEDGLLADIDELGQPIILDELTGDVVGGEGYYGWSRSFCERMKRRRKGIQGPNDEDDRGRRSRSSSREPRKRRYSDSDRSSVSDHGRRRRRRSYSSSRSPSTDNDRRAIGTRRSRSPFNPSHEATNNLPPKPLTSSYPVPPSMYPHGINPNFPPPPPPPQPPFTNQGPPYGNWVPPPPPPPLHNMQFNNGQQQFGSWPPPPPPIPPPNMPPGGWQHHQAQGRGYNNNNNNGGWQGRGGRGGYRGRGW